MKKSYKIEVDCANCAQKMEDAANTVAGVEKATVNFMTQKLTLEADDAEFDEVLNRVVEFTADAEPDCENILKPGITQTCKAALAAANAREYK